MATVTVWLVAARKTLLNQGARPETQALQAVPAGCAFRQKSVGPRALVGSLALLSFLVGCEPDLIVGKWSGEGGEAGGGDGGGAGGPASCDAASGEASVSMTDPVAMPWSTSFENEFCDYMAAGGYCYAAARAGYATVSSPAHSGNSAAAFSLVTDGGFDGLQARCVRPGELPRAAYSSAYCNIPAEPTSASNCNLMHFRGGEGVQHADLTWDLSLARQADGSFQLYVYDHFRPLIRPTTNLPSVPIGEWFQLTAYLSRSTDATGELAVYQDGELGLRLTDLVTDKGAYGEWYVGNLAVALTPENTVLYVDDVAISDAL